MTFTEVTKESFNTWYDAFQQERLKILEETKEGVLDEKLSGKELFLRKTAKEVEVGKDVEDFNMEDYKEEEKGEDEDNLCFDEELFQEGEEEDIF